jgi:hypothetical protein
MNITVINENGDWSTRDKRINTQTALGEALALSIVNPTLFANKFGLDAPPVALAAPNVASIQEVRNTMRVRLLKEIKALGANWGAIAQPVGYGGNESLVLLYDATKFAVDKSYKPKNDASTKTIAAKLDWIGGAADDDGEVEHRKSIIMTATHWPRTAYAVVRRGESAVHRNTAILLEHAIEQDVDSVDGSGDYNLGKKDYHDITLLAKALQMSVGSFAFPDNSCDNIWSSHDPLDYTAHSFGYGLFSHAPQLASTVF